MLSITAVEEIGFHLEAGQLTHRAIAKKVGVSRSTVAALAWGRRGSHGRSPDPEPLEPPEFAAPAPPARCPECGYLVHLPCLICRTREYCRARQIFARSSSLRAPAPHTVLRRSARQRRSFRRRVA